MTYKEQVDQELVDSLINLLSVGEDNDKALNVARAVLNERHFQLNK